MKKTIFLTGATGTMGFAGVQEILRYPEKYNLRILARPSGKNKEKLAPYADKLEVIWGDLTNYEDILRGVTGADIVLHVGGMVSPQADYRPKAKAKAKEAAKRKALRRKARARLWKRFRASSAVHWFITGSIIVALLAFFYYFYISHSIQFLCNFPYLYLLL